VLLTQFLDIVRPRATAGGSSSPGRPTPARRHSHRPAGVESSTPDDAWCPLGCASGRRWRGGGADQSTPGPGARRGRDGLVPVAYTNGW